MSMDTALRRTAYPESQLAANLDTCRLRSGQVWRRVTGAARQMAHNLMPSWSVMSG